MVIKHTKKNELKGIWLFIVVAVISFCSLFILSFFFGSLIDKISPAKAVAQNSPAEREWEDRNKEKPFVMLVQENKLEFSGSEIHLLMRQVIRIQTDEAKDVGEIKFEYDKNTDKITGLKAVTRTADGRVLKPSMIQDRNKVVDGNFYSDAREKVLTMPEAVPGSIIEIWLRKRSKLPLNKINQVVSLRFDCPVKYLRWEISVPKNIQCRVLSRNAAIKPKISSVGKNSVYLWQREYIDGYIKERNSPPEGEFTEEMIFSSFNSWSEIGSLFRAKFDKSLDLTGKMVLVAQGSIAGKATEIEKINAILEYVHSQLRYVSISDSRYFGDSRKASVILDQKFGNCSEYTNLSRALLKAAGIISYPVLVCNYENGNPANKLPGQYFGHVILGVKLAGKYYYSDPQIPGYQLNETPSQLSGAYIFVLDDKPFLSQLPFAPASVNKKDIRVKLGEDGSALVHEFENLTGDDAVGYALRLQKTRQRIEDITSSFNSRLGIRLVERNVILQKDGSVQFDTIFNDDTFGFIAGETIMFGLGSDALNWLPVERKERKLPFNAWGNGPSWLTRVVYDIPPGFEIVYLPVNYEFSNDFVSFSRKYYTDNKDTITEIETISTKPCWIPASGYAQLVSSLDSMVAASKEMMCIQKKKNKPPAPSKKSKSLR